MIRTVIVGSGAVAERLALETAGNPQLELVQVWARDPARGSWLAREAGTEWAGLTASLAPADLYIVSVSDAAVAEVTAALPFPPGAVVAHTAGSVAMDAIDGRIADRAVLYPLQTFTRGRRIKDFRRTAFFIEGATPRALETVRGAANALSDNVTEMDSCRRARIHLAGSFANNFSNAMFSLAEEIAAGAGAPFDALRPMIAETVAKAMEMPSPRLAQTGPAQRGDRGIQSRHLDILAAEYPGYVEIYKQISDIIWLTSKKNSQK